MIRMCFDYGHGGSDPGATYKGRKEKDDVLKLGLTVAKDLRRHGVIVDETRTTDATVSLGARSSYEKKGSYDYFISFHRNAFKPEQGRGAEVFTYTAQTPKAKSLANRVQKSLVEVGFRDRGVKKANFHVLRETKAPAVLIEVGFIDSTNDNQIFDSKFDEIVKVMASAILDEAGVKYVESNIPVAPVEKGETHYRVMAGSYKDRKNAQAQMEKLKRAGIDATIMIFSK